MKILLFTTGLLIALLSFSFHSTNQPKNIDIGAFELVQEQVLDSSSSSSSLLQRNIYDLLLLFGEPNTTHEVNSNISSVSPLKGKEIFTQGYTTNDLGQTTDIQSKFFVCTSCHNNVMEDPDLTVSDPQKRLEYAKAHGLPFLQGTTAYGITNRETFYNGSYYLKYGKEKVAKAHNDLREAIQLCAIGCAQGRALKDWEIESVLSYFWTLQLKVKDLNCTQEELKFIARGIDSTANMDSARVLIKSKYLQASPATFVTPPPNRRKGYGLIGNPANGKDIYEMSCLHCHKNGRYAYYYLDYDPMTMRHLRYHFPRFTNYSSYQVIRWGTHPLTGKKAYMPQYTLERMSNQQVEDLRSFFEHPF